MSGDKIHYITIATKPHPVLERIKSRVQENGEEVQILGLEENRVIGWESNQNFGVKLREVANYVNRSTLDPNDLLLFTDAYDVAYCGDLEEIKDRYLSFKKPIVFGCEKKCNPDPDRANEYADQSMEFPFLNSGMFIGRIWAIRICIANYQYNDGDDDQRFWTNQFFQKPHLIELDYTNQIFLNTVDIDMSFFLWTPDGAMYRTATPQFVHVNGPIKTMIDTLV
jgi:hypothetical protein